MSVDRQRLPDRRSHGLLRFECDGQSYTGGIGRFKDGWIAEVFINGTKVGTAGETNAQDAAIVASLALQHGCPVDIIWHALPTMVSLLANAAKTNADFDFSKINRSYWEGLDQAYKQRTRDIFSDANGGLPRDLKTGAFDLEVSLNRKSISPFGIRAHRP